MARRDPREDDEDDEDDEGGDDDEDERGDDDEDDRPTVREASARLGHVAVDGAGAFLAVFAYPLFLNLLKGGPAQMWGWVRAKWTNQPYAG